MNPTPHHTHQTAQPTLNPALLTLSKTLELILNTAIQLDEMKGVTFSTLENQVIAITLTPIQQPLYFLVVQNTIAVQSHLEGEANAHIHTSLQDFACLPIHQTLPNAKLSGDAQQAQQFIDALCTLDIDWEEQLSHYTGDLIAFKVGHGIRSLFKTQQKIQHNLSQILKEYLQFEMEAMPTQDQVKRFCQDVENMTTHTHALETRINALFTPSKKN